MKQPVYTVIDEKFEDFVANNTQMLEDMPYNEIINVANKDRANEFYFTSSGLLKEPFKVSFIGKMSSGEDDIYVFFDNEMNRSYTYKDKG